MEKIYFLCNKLTGTIESIGPLPEVWKSVTGLAHASYADVSDLAWAGYPDMGFLTEEDALKIGASSHIIEAQKLKSADSQWDRIREDRDKRIEEVRWRIERHSDEVQIGSIPSENVMPLLKYVQELRDITSQPDPFNIKWPPMPY